jgi:hypothetical protein
VLEAHAGALTEVVVGGLHVGDATGALAGDVSTAALAIARKHGLRVLERVDDLRDGDPHPADVTAIASNRERLGKLTRELAGRLERDRADGVVVELSDDGTEAGAEARETIVRDLRTRLAKDRRALAVAVRAGIEAAELMTYASLADRVYVHARLDAEDLAAQGPAAPRGWFQETAARISAFVPDAKLVLVLPTHGVGWPVREKDLAPAGAGHVVAWGEMRPKAGPRPRAHPTPAGPLHPRLRARSPRGRARAGTPPLPRTSRRRSTTRRTRSPRHLPAPP